MQDGLQFTQGVKGLFLFPFLSWTSCETVKELSRPSEHLLKFLILPAVAAALLGIIESEPRMKLLPLRVVCPHPAVQRNTMTPQFRGLNWEEGGQEGREG